MKKNLLMIFLLMLSLVSKSQIVTFANSTINNRTEWYLPNSPTNMDNNRTVVGWIKGGNVFRMNQPVIQFNTLAGSGIRHIAVGDTGQLYSVNQYSVNSIDTNILSTKYWATTSFQSTLGFTPYNGTTNPNGYISSFTETDPNVPSYVKSITLTEKNNWNTAFGWGNHSTVGYLTSINSSQVVTALGYSPLSSESDPVWLADKSNYITNSTATATYSVLSHTHTFVSLTSKPTTLSGYGITDAYPLAGNPSNFLTSIPAQTFVSLTSKPTTLSGYGITDAYPLSGNPSSFLTSVPAQSFASLTTKPTTIAGYGITDFNSLWDIHLATKTTNDITEGNVNFFWTASRSNSALTLTAINTALGYTAYNAATNSSNFITPSSTNTLTNKSGNISQWTNDASYVTSANVSKEYINTASTTSGSAVFYLTSDKTSTGTALYTNVLFVNPVVNDVSNNYTFGWTVSADKKTLTVTSKIPTATAVALIGLTVLGLPVNVINGTNITVLVKGN